MYVCLCAAVTVSEVRASVVSGADTVERVGERCFAGTGCGTCHDHIQALLDQHRESVLALARTA